MKFTHILILIGFAGIFKFCLMPSSLSDKASADFGASSSNIPFISFPLPEGHRMGKVYVLAVPNCPKGESQRADNLAERLSQQGIPAERISQVGINMQENFDPALVNKFKNALGGTMPVVFVNGWAKNNPTFDEVVAQLNSH